MTYPNIDLNDPEVVKTVYWKGRSPAELSAIEVIKVVEWARNLAVELNSYSHQTPVQSRALALKVASLMQEAAKALFFLSDMAKSREAAE